MEDPNRLHVFLKDDERQGLGGFRAILVSEPDHPYVAQWWPPGHVIGWEHTFAHQWRAFLEAVIDGRPIDEEQASFEDAARVSDLCDRIYEAAASGRRVAFETAPAGSGA